MTVGLAVLLWKQASVWRETISAWSPAAYGESGQFLCYCFVFISKVGMEMMPIHIMNSRTTWQKKIGEDGGRRKLQVSVELWTQFLEKYTKGCFGAKQ